jgi:hypothetical protein
MTGIARGGNGGVVEGGVQVKTLKDAGHLVCFEKPTQVAAEISGWLTKETARWDSERSFWNSHDKQISTKQGTEMSETWIKGVKSDPFLQRSVTENKPRL